MTQRSPQKEKPSYRLSVNLSFQAVGAGALSF